MTTFEITRGVLPLLLARAGKAGLCMPPAFPALPGDYGRVA